MALPRSSIRVPFAPWIAEGVEPPTGPPPVTPTDPRPRRRGSERERKRQKKDPDPEPVAPPPDPEDPKGRRIDIQAQTVAVSL